MLANKVEVSFIVKGVEVDKALRFNKEILATAYFCFTRDFFSLFYSYYFFNVFFVD